MSNPVLQRTFESQKTPAGYPVHPGHQAGQGTQWTTSAPTGTQAPYVQPGHLPEVGYEPALGTDRMTVDDVVVKTGTLVGLVAVVAVLAAIFSGMNPALSSTLWLVGLIGGLVFGLINSFRREPSVPLILAYAVFEGMLLGALSFWANTLVPGVVGQAVLATFIVAGISLALYRSGAVKVTDRFRRVLQLALLSYLAFVVINLIAMIFLPTGLFGIRSVEAGGVAIGLGIGLIAVVIASMSLIADFDSITKGVQAGVPARYAWTAAFGITVTLVWMYIEILRILMILFSDR